MKKSGINWNFKKITATILGILGIGMLTSCYGMPQNPDAFEEELWKTTTEESAGSETITSEASK